MQNVRHIILFDFAFSQAASHLHTHTQHGFGDFDMLTLHERFGIRREIKRYQRTLVIGTTQLDTSVR